MDVGFLRTFHSEVMGLAAILFVFAIVGIVLLVSKREEVRQARKPVGIAMLIIIVLYVLWLGWAMLDRASVNRLPRADANRTTVVDKISANEDAAKDAKDAERKESK